MLDPGLLRFLERDRSAPCGRRQPIVDELVSAYAQHRQPRLTPAQRADAACWRRVDPTPQPPGEPNLFAEIARGFVGGSATAPGAGPRQLGHALSNLFALGDLRDAAANVRRARWRAAGIDLVGLVPLVGDGVKRLGRADAIRTGRRPPSSMVAARLLRQRLAEEALEAVLASQRLERGRPIVVGSQIRDLRRLLATYGGRPEDWRKMSSSIHVSDGVRYQTHWYEDVGRRVQVEFKVKMEPAHGS